MNSATKIRFTHTNIVAKDWRRLAEFYVRVFDCVPVSSERDHHGPQFEALTAQSKARVRGRHFRLPGHGKNAPTLEIFQYESENEKLSPEISRPGFAHIAFEVPDLVAKREEILEWGGRDYGEVVTLDIGGAGKLTLCYMCDPEDNLVELQTWQNRQVE
ncbi:MAG: hypothetical protein L0Z50_32120 [Verrucomicrobiales bacterium]|nr:hypothetical protein [Verrucomicrobiales bacterium]